MNIKRSYTGIGSENDKEYITFLVYPDGDTQSFEVFQEYENSTTLTYFTEDQLLTVYLLGEHLPHILNIQLEREPSTIEMDGKELKKNFNFTWNEESKKLHIKTTNYKEGTYKIYY
jgi:hypothetical protein